MARISTCLTFLASLLSPAAAHAQAQAQTEPRFFVGVHGGFNFTLPGVAGPGGGTPEKPVGTVWIAVADAAGSVARRTIFPGSRQEIRSRAAQAALFLLNRRLAG
jgi:nicotinamide mononucleotide (NMN) deamidase PncC